MNLFYKGRKSWVLEPVVLNKLFHKAICSYFHLCLRKLGDSFFFKEIQIFRNVINDKSLFLINNCLP